jgi:D-aminoacyl-tRNA deacylase
MRAVIQRVQIAELAVKNSVLAHINKGLLVLLAIEESDKIDDILWLSKKIVLLRIFNDKNGIMNNSLKDINGEMMIVSQFTLFASTKRGNRPSYIRAARQEYALEIYNKFIKQVEIDLGKSVKTGIFGADMQIFLVNDGPVTIIFDTKDKE